MEEIKLISEILNQYKYSPKLLKKNINLFFNNESKNEKKYKIGKAVFQLEMFFFEAENIILLENNYLEHKIKLNVFNLSNGKYRNQLYFSDVVKIKNILIKKPLN